MFLKSLTLKGFKSFAEATTLELEPGVSVVVGPNGSGKSNVVDAIAWVLGAQAPSAVRSQKMDDVIFAGTARRAALGRAEVSLTIDNESGILPIEFSEVTLTRTLFRTGDSEYAINGAPCRLLDLQELLSDAGVGRQQHVIVSQGQIDAVLNARAEERRAIIEEAAGVLKYRKRKEKAERRLDATEGNLLRVQDLLREVRRQLRPLERQAEAARRHGDLVGELSALRIFLAGREIAGLRTRMTVLATETAAAERSERELRRSLAGFDTEVLATEAELSARGDTDVGGAMMRVEQLRERARGIANVMVERRRALERDRGQLIDAGVVASLESDAARVRAELQEIELALLALRPEADRLGEDERTFARERAETTTALDEAGAGPARATGAAGEVRGELRSMRTSIDRADQERLRLDRRHADLVAKAERWETEMARLRAACEETQAVEEPLVAELESAEARRVAAEAALDAARAAQQEAGAQFSHWQARADALGQALDSARARAGAERLAGLDGVLGTLLELVEIDEGWEPAFEAAVGETMSAVVVADASAGRAALQRLADGELHGAVVALGGPLRLALAPSAGDPVRAHVRSADVRVAELLDTLVGSATRVANWAEALDASLANPDAVVVTSDGHRFSPTGWRLGVAGGGATAAALDDAVGRAAASRAALAVRDAELGEAQAELDAARQAEMALARRLDANDARFTASSEALVRVQGERREVLAEVEAVEQSVVELDQRLTRERRRAAELEELVPALEADEAAEVAAARQRGEIRARLEAGAALLASRRKDLEVRNAGLLDRRVYLARRLEEIERRLEADVAARAAAGDHRERIERSLGVLDRLAAIVDAHRQTIEAELARLTGIRRRQSEEVRTLTLRLDAARRGRSAAEKELEEVRAVGRRAEIDQAEARMRMEAAVEGLRRDHDIEPAVAEAAEMPPLPEGIGAPARVRDLERELRLLGPINPLALEEFNALQERHRFLDEQLEDVRNTRRELMRVIRAVDAEIQGVFAAAFADVSANFTQLFALLFPGGQGKLTLTNPDDLLATGIEVEAKPSGKNVKKLSLLSGGERSLTALAFLFAVFRSRPSPFYVMDEVEAALDDVNLHRFLGLVAEFRNEAQLLIVSHQKRTMEAADCLLGVTMQPGGSSKVIVERAGSRTG